MTPNGQIDHKILSAQSEALKTELTGKYATLTVGELKTAFKRGIYGESGPYFGMCPKTYNQFLKWYIELPDRGKAWIEYMKLIEGAGTSSKPVFYTDEKLKMMVLDAFNTYKINGSLPIAGACVLFYDTLKKANNGETLIDQANWENIKTEGRKSYSNAMSLTKTAKDAKLMVLDYSMQNASFAAHVKKIAIRFYFDLLISKKQDLKL
jgi:hypothetical protein